MNRLVWAVAALAALVASVSAVAQQPASPPETAVATTVATDKALQDENLLLFEVLLDRLSVTDSLPSYATPDGPFIPLGELARLLDVDLIVSAANKRVTGTIGAARRAVLVDVATATARLGGETIPLAPGDVAVGLTDIYVKPALLEKILPVKLVIDGAALRITMTALEPLPIQSRADRLARLRELQGNVDGTTEVLRLTSPHRLFSWPTFDVALESGTGARDPKLPRRYDIRAGADMLFTGFQGFLGSDDRGVPTSARALFERRDPKGRLFGVGITRASAGDIFTPSLPIGARSIGGRGISATTAPLEQTSVFERIDLRGELPIGFDVELYVNDVLRSGQETPVQGRYEFRDVPLVRGINVIRVVSYGPRGERTEEVRVISVGGGQLAKGQTTVDAGVAQQERSVIQLRSGDPVDVVSPGNGDLRFVANISHGLTEGLTLTGGLANYAPSGGQQRILGTLGVRTSLFGLATQVDVARDDGKGTGLALAFAGQPFGVSTIGRHSEYRGGFVDETIPRGGDGRALKRFSELTFDLALKPFGGASLPLSLRAERDEFVDGQVSMVGTIRASTSIGTIQASGGLDYDRTTTPGFGTSDRLTGVVTASTYAAFKWQLRASLDYDVLPTAKVRAVSFTADRDIGKNVAVRLGLGQSFLEDRDTTVQGGAIFRLPFGDLSLNGEYSAPGNNYRVGLQFAFSLVRDPLRGRYVITRTGAAAGGNLAVQAFVDRNGNDLFDPDEAPVSGVSINAGVGSLLTNDKGQAFVTGLGYAPVVRVQAGLDEVDLPYVTSPPATIEFTPRAGRVVKMLYPLKPQGELLARLVFKQPGGRLVGLSAVRLRAVRADGKMIEASTEYDGTVVFDRLEAGNYRIEIEPEQAARLRMSLATQLNFVVPPDGGVLPDIKSEVVFESPSK